MENCQNFYKSGLYVTIDEQLVGFRGHCPFKMYIGTCKNKIRSNLCFMFFFNSIL